MALSGATPKPTDRLATKEMNMDLTPAQRRLLALLPDHEKPNGAPRHGALARLAKRIGVSRQRIMQVWDGEPVRESTLERWERAAR
jgi:hypothetical protein